MNEWMDTNNLPVLEIVGNFMFLHYFSPFTPFFIPKKTLTPNLLAAPDFLGCEINFTLTPAP